MTHQPESPAAPDALFRRIVESSQGLICVHDLSGTLLYVNPASAAELGYAVEEMVGRNGGSLLAPAVRPLFQEYLARIRIQKADKGVLRLTRRDGTERLWAYRNVLREGEGGGEAYVIGHAVDVTDFWRAKQELRESQTRSAAVLAALDEGVVFCGADGEVIEFNRSAERILGMSPEYLFGAGSAPPELIREDGSLLPAAERPNLETLRTGQPCRGVICGVRRGALPTIWLELNSQPLSRLPEGEPHGVVVSFSDITERRRREQARNEELREAMADLKILGGLLPICAGCKKIRDADGRWQQLEAYIHAHSQAEFTHGLCPTCLERLYPGEAS